MLPATLQISLVNYASDIALLTATIVTLKQSVDHAIDQNLVSQVHLDLIDNGPGDTCRKTLHGLVDIHLPNNTTWSTNVHEPGANIGFGRAHNISILAGISDYHLVLNPDLELSKEYK